MTTFYINKNGQQSGPFDEAKVREMLKNGQLLASDLGIKHGESQWQRLSDMFQGVSSDALPPRAIANQTVEKPEKQGKGCRGLLGIGLIVFGIFIVFGGLANCGLRQKNLSSSACDLYEKAFRESEEAFAKYQKDKTFSNEENWKSKLDSAQSWKATCSSVNSASVFWRNITIGLSIVGLLMLIIGVLLRIF
jgi:hypothetical protein